LLCEALTVVSCSYDTMASKTQVSNPAMDSSKEATNTNC